MRYITFILLLAGSNNAIAEHLGGDYVVILHGIARSSSHMEDLAEHLEQQGYEVINQDYQSTDFTLQQLIDRIHRDISKQITRNKPVHFVGYSMGGLMVRAIINEHRPQNLGRVVQLAPPNKGSEVADFLKNNWLYQAIYGPAGQQLTTDQEAIEDIFGEVDYELGIIAGNSTIDPISSAIIPGDDDGKVSVESTKLEGMKDHIVVSASHTFFPSNETVHQQTEHFIKHGYFDRQEEE